MAGQRRNFNQKRAINLQLATTPRAFLKWLYKTYSRNFSGEARPPQEPGGYYELQHKNAPILQTRLQFKKDGEEILIEGEHISSNAGRWWNAVEEAAFSEFAKHDVAEAAPALATGSEKASTRRRYAPTQPAAFNRWRKVWEKIEPLYESGMTDAPDLYREMHSRAAFKTLPGKPELDTLRKIIKAGANGELDT